MKTCFRCGIPKPLGDFYAHPQMADGHLNKCKLCTRADSERRYFSKTPEILVKGKAYHSTEHGKGIRKKAGANYKARYKDKIKAHNEVAKALTAGIIVKLPCCVCGQQAVAHHPDYSKPLDVVWLCEPHHKEEHRRLRRGMPSLTPQQQ